MGRKELKLLLNSKNKFNSFEELFIKVASNEKEFLNYLYDKFNYDCFSINTNKLMIYFSYTYNNRLITFNLYDDEIVYNINNDETIIEIIYDQYNINELIEYIHSIVLNINKKIDGDIFSNMSNTEVIFDSIKKYSKFSRNNTIILYICALIFVITMILGLFLPDFFGFADKYEYISFICVFGLSSFLMVFISLLSFNNIFLYKNIIKDKENNSIYKDSFNVKKVRLIMSNTNSNCRNVYGVLLITDKNKLIIPFSYKRVLRNRRKVKEFYQKCLNNNFTFTYFKNSKVVINNNSYYENLFVKLLERK